MVTIEQSNESKKTQGYRAAIPQVLAVMVKNIVLVSCGMLVGYNTILIPNLSGDDEDEILQFSQGELSWLGSLPSVVIALGCIFSGLITKPIGRKRSMQILSVPLIGCWLFFKFSSAHWHIFTAVSIGGFIGGLLEAPLITYVAEITQPNLRGALAGTAVVSLYLGAILQYFLATFLRWRTIALVSIAPLVLSISLLFFVPESPHWLIMRGRDEEARKSLAWLRGWTSVDDVTEEFEELVAIRGGKRSKQVFEIGVYKKKRFLWPFALMGFMGFLSSFTGLPALNTYSVLIFDTLQVPIDKYYATLIMGATMMSGSLVCVFLVPYFGKRRTCFLSIIGAVACYTTVAAYAHANNITHLTVFKKTTTDARHTWIPLVFLTLLPLVCYSGLAAVPWIMVGEVYPKEVRVTASGVTTALTYVFKFANTKLFFRMVATLTLPGTFWVFAGTALGGLVVLYFVLPETEGKALHEIEEHFAGGKKLKSWKES